MLNRWLSIAALISFTAGLSLQAANACTEVLLNKSQGVVVSGRTLDYQFDMNSHVCFKVKGAEVSDPGLKYTKHKRGTPLKWKSKYSAILVDAFHQPAYVDGMNTEGLSVGTLWHSDTQPAPRVAEGKHLISNVSLIEYILENAKDVDEAKALMSDLSVVLAVYRGQALALHWIVTDKTGKSVVMELKGGSPIFFDQSTEVGVVANSPNYDLQLANLEAQKQAQSSNPDYILPGDYKSKSRFVRSAYFVSHMPEFKSSDQAISATTQVLHNVEARKNTKGRDGSWTQWIAVRDQTNMRYIVMGLNHPAPKVYDLRTIDFEQLADKKFSVENSASNDVASSYELKFAQIPSTQSPNRTRTAIN